MPYHYKTPLIDPFFSQKLLTTEPAQLLALEEELNKKIEKLYEYLIVKKPVYYEGSETGRELEAFAKSDAFSSLITQLEVCIAHLKSFCDKQAIEIQRDENLELGSSLLNTFFEQLSSDYFSDHRALLYSVGKKYLETITVFINEEKIDLAFREIQINQLLSDQGLTQSCAEGCFTRLQNAAENFKNYGVFDVPILFKRYIQRLTDDIIHRPIYLGGVESISSKIAKLMEYSPEAFEIHGRNYALKVFKESFKLKFIEVVEDSYVSRIEDFLARNTEENLIITSDFHYLYHYFRQEATTAGWIDYLSEEICSSIPKEEAYMRRIEFLEKTALQSLGPDPQFSLGDVIEEGSGLVKPKKYLSITLTERLLNSGWLEFNLAKLFIKDSLFSHRNKNWSIKLPFQPFAENYKIFYNNLELSWLKIEGQRTLFIDLLASEQGIQSIRALHADQVVLLNTLLQTPKDLLTFLNHIQFASSETIINWLKLDGGIITKALSYYRTESVTAILEPIFYVMGNVDQHGRSFFLEQIVGYRTVKDLLQDKIRVLSSLVVNNNAVDIMNALIRKSISIGISDFSHFIFYRNNQRIQRVCYLNQINFSNSNWIMTQFIEDVYSCHFYRMTLRETVFYGYLIFSAFVETSINDSYFYDSVIRCSFYLNNLNNLIFYQGVLTSTFEDSDLVQIEFKNIVDHAVFRKSRMSINKFLDVVSQTNFNMADMRNVLFNKKIMDSHFNFAHLKLINFHGDIDKCSFELAYLIKVIFHSNLSESNFRLADLDEIIFQKQAEQIDFEITRLKRVNFQDKVFRCVFNQAKQVDIIFFKSVVASPFIGATLNKIKFHDEVGHCDFTSAYLDEIQFLGMLTQVKFNDVILKNSKFLGNVYRSDFSEAKIEKSVLEDLVIKNIKFNKVSMNEVDFTGTYLNKVKLNQVSFEKISFKNAIFEQSGFNHCEMNHVSFRHAIFNQKVEFKYTTFKNVDFNYCDLSQVDFSWAFMHEITLKKAVINVEQLFNVFHFNKVQDLSDVFLKGSEMIPERFLSIYGQRTLHDVILSESIFQGLIALGYKNFEGVNLKHMTKYYLTPFYHNSAYNFENIVLPSDWNEQQPLASHLSTESTERTEEVSDIRSCLPEGRRRRQEKTNCLIDWLDVDHFNREKEYSRVVDKISIDQAAFTAALQKTTSLQKRKQLMQLAQSVTSDQNQLPSVAYWRNTQKIKQHFTYVDRLLKGATQGIIYEEMLQELIHGDYKHVCMNFGVIGGSIVSSKFAQKMVKQGDKLILDNKVVLGRTLKIMAPFVRSTPISAYIIVDLIQEVQALKAGDREALVGVISDGLFLAIEATETGIETAEALGLIFDISSFTGPLGETAGALIFLGFQGYHAFEEVKSIKSVKSLSGWQTFVEAFYAFLGIDPPIHIQALLALDQAYATYKKNIYDFLKENPKIKRYIVPSVDIQFDQKTKLLLKDYVFNNSPPLVRTSVYTDENSFVWLIKEPQIGWLFYDMNPLKNHFDPQALFCNPYKITVDYNRTRICDRALVIENPWAEQEDVYTLWRLGEGNDSGYSYLPEINIFIVNDGYKIYKGSNQSDIFILDGALIWGLLDGDKGVDTLDVNHYASDKKKISIDFFEGTLAYDGIAPLYLRRFERILGRKGKWDTLLVSSELEFIDLRGGDKPYFDEIKIPETFSHQSKIEMVVWPETIVNNKAKKGVFDYIITVDRSLNQTEGWSILLFSENGTASQNRLLFQFDLHELNAIELSPSEVELNFYFTPKNASISNFKTTVVYPPIQAEYILMDQTQIQVGEDDHFFAFHKSNQSVSQLITTYRPFAQRLNMTLMLYQELDNEVIVIGRSQAEVFYNDINASKTHLVGNGGNDTYLITENTYLNQSAHEVILYDFGDHGHQTLDLRLFNKQFSDGILDNPQLSLTLMKLANDLQLLIYQAEEQSDASLSKPGSFLRVTLHDGLNWYQHLTVLCNYVPLHLVRGPRPMWHLQPLPLHFNAEQNTLIITPHDVERENQIFLDRKAGQYQFYRDASDLYLTNWLHYPQNKTQLYNILFREFYDHDKMRTLTLNFSDITLKIMDLTYAIDSAMNLNERLILLEQETWRALLSSPETLSAASRKTTPSLRRRRAANQSLFSEKAVRADFTSPDSSYRCDQPYFLDQHTAMNSEQTTWRVDEQGKFTHAASRTTFFSRLQQTNVLLPNNSFAANDTFHTAHCESFSTPQSLKNETFRSNKKTAYSSISFIDTLEFLNFLIRRYFSSSKSKLRRLPMKSAIKDTSPAPNFFAQMGLSQNDSEAAMTTLEKKVKTAIDVAY